jgi:hypothetical protein
VKLEDVYEALTAPFAPDLVELKPGATNKERTKACAMAYVAVWEYRRRLNEAVGAGNWSQELRMLDANTMVCRLTVLGAVREEVGEEAESEEQRADNTSCNRAAQAFKRACAALGLGLYLYDLPQKWLEFDGQRRRFAESVDLQRVVNELYRQAGIQWPPKPKPAPSTLYPDLVAAIRSAPSDAALDVCASKAKEHRKAGRITREQLETLGRESVLRREALRPSAPTREPGADEDEDDFFTDPTPDNMKAQVKADVGAHRPKAAGLAREKEHKEGLDSLARIGKLGCPEAERAELDMVVGRLLLCVTPELADSYEAESNEIRWSPAGRKVVDTLFATHRQHLAEGAK